MTGEQEGQHCRQSGSTIEALDEMISEYGVYCIVCYGFIEERTPMFNGYIEEESSLSSTNEYERVLLLLWQGRNYRCTRV